MGNCCVTESSMNWGGDDWGSLSSKRRSMSSGKVFDEVHEASLDKVEKEKLLGALRASSDANGKVKIKISKKELAQLLGGKESNNKHLGEEGHASVEQVLARLIHARDHAINEYHDVHHRPWRPVLQSIPEVN